VAPFHSTASHTKTAVIVETVAFAVSVFVVTYTVQDGKSNYLEGCMLLGLYLIIAVAFYVTPSDALDKMF
jgi:Ca2+:H+ antiporter